MANNDRRRRRPNQGSGSGRAKTPAKTPTVGQRRPAKTPTGRKAPQPDRRGDGAAYFLRDFTPHTGAVDPLRDRVRGSILWSAYGDSCGMPFEGQAPLAIHERNGGEWVEGLEVPGNNFSRYLGRGGWTDDTQLSICLMNAFIECGGNWDMDAIARHHVASFDIGPRGWGSSTRESVLKLKRGASWRKSGKPGGAGNGIPMKIGPVALSFGIRHAQEIKDGNFQYSELVNLARNIAVMTHRDSRAVVAGICHCILTVWAMNDVDPVERWDDLMNLLRRVEATLPDMGETISSRLDWIQRAGLGRDVEYFAHLYRTGCFVIESYPFSVATYLLYRANVVDGILAAVNAGGDCDTTAAIVGDLCGAEAGLGTEDRTLDLEQHNNLLGIADAFYDSAASD